MQKIIPVLMMFVISGYCFAEMEYRGEAYGLVGMNWSHDDESYLGDGLNIGGGVGFRANDHFAFTFEADHSSFSRDFSSGVHFEGTAVTLAGNVRLYFSADKVKPSFPDDQPPVIFRFEDNVVSVQFGGGVNLRLTERVSLRPEFRWTYNEISFINQLRGSVALAYHW